MATSGRTGGIAPHRRQHGAAHAVIASSVQARAALDSENAVVR